MTTTATGGLTPGRTCAWCPGYVGRPAAAVEYRVGRGDWRVRGIGACAEHAAPTRDDLLARWPDRMIYVRTAADPRTREVRD